MKDDIEDLQVEFKAAGASSLDYQIYMILNGRTAKAYFRVQRMVQQACVDSCNREGWGIPFTQITVHSGDSATIPVKPGNTIMSGETQIAATPSQDPV